jgi:hypothetical protein
VKPPPRFTEGPPRYFRPVCVLRRLGFVGGPVGYVETDSREGGPVVVKGKEGTCVRHLCGVFRR